METLGPHSKHVQEKQSHHQLENNRLARGIPCEAAEHRAVLRQVCIGAEGMVQPHFFSLDDQQQRKLAVRKVWCCEYQRRAEKHHVGVPFVAAEPAVAVCPDHVGGGHLHCIQSITHYLGCAFLLHDAL